MPKRFKPDMGRGDDGTTGLLLGRRVPKTDVRVKANALIDELNAWLGLAKTLKGPAAKERAMLQAAQKNLFSLSAHIAGLDNSKIIESGTRGLEKEIARLSENLPELKSFLIPGKNETDAVLHLAKPCAVYLNRLSDYLFLLARTSCK
jgi:cob(I)alamin adenosyltransferase